MAGDDTLCVSGVQSHSDAHIFPDEVRVGAVWP